MHALVDLHPPSIIFTHVTGDTQTWIDHVLTKNITGYSLAATTSVTAVLQLNHQSLEGGLISDHRPLIVCTRLTPVVKHRKVASNLRPPVSTSLFRDHQKVKYTAAMEEFIQSIPITTSTQAALHLKTISNFSSAFCRRYHRLLKKKPPSQRWSPEFELIRINIAFLRTLLQLVTRARPPKNEPWYSKFCINLQHWAEVHAHHVSRNPQLQVLRFGPDPRAWVLLQDSLPALTHQLSIEAERCAALSISCQQRELRGMLSTIASKVQVALGAKKLKPVISITGNKTKAMLDLSYVIAHDKVIADPSAVHETCTKHFQHHHSLNPVTFPVDIDWTTPASVLEALPTFQHHCQSILPEPLHWTIASLWHGFTAPWTQVPSDVATNRVNAAVQVLAPCPLLEELTDAIQRSPTSSPGISGLSFSHIKLWSAPTVIHIHHLLSLLWEDNHLTPDHWNWKLLCPIPKADKDPQVLDNLRPIMLVECLRKLWVGILIRRLSVFLTKEDFLSKSQHGYVARRSTVTSGLQLVDSLDDFNENRIDIFLSSWDFTKAFDTLPFSLSHLSLRRAFMPLDLADWLLQLDTDGRIIVRTPYALDNLRRNRLQHFQLQSSPTNPGYFQAGAGVSQGDVHSPYIWRLFIDILLCALEHLRPLLDPFPTIQSSDFGYADDIISLACSLLNIQQKADIVSAFSIITGISISWSKLRATCHEWDVHTPNPSLTVWDTNSLPHVIPLARGLTVRHLGFQVSTTGEDHTALAVTKAEMELSAAHFLRRGRWLPKEAVFQTIALQTISQISYSTQLSTYSSKQLQSLESLLSNVYRTICQLWNTFPTAMLHLPRSLCGLGLPSICNATYTSKYRILQRSLHPSSLGNDIIHRYLRGHGVTPSLHHEVTVPDPSARRTRVSGYWLDNLLTHCHKSGLALRRSGPFTDLSSEIPLVTLLPQHRKYWLFNGLACLGDLFDPINQCWIRIPPRIRSALPPIDDITFVNYLRVGQLWRLLPDSDVVTEILGIQSSAFVTTRLWKLLPPTTSGTHIELTAHFDGPICRANLFNPRSQAERIYTRGDVVNQQIPSTTRKIWRRQLQPIPELPSFPHAGYFSTIMSHIQTHYSDKPIKIYTDGSWKASGCGRDRALLLTTSSVGGASFVVTSSTDWQLHPVLIFQIQDDLTSPTAHAYTWELAALATAALIQSRHPAGCQLFSDCTSAIHTISTITPSESLLDPNSVLLYPVSRLKHRPVVTHVPAHPEIRVGKTRAWTQDEWGIHIADVAASSTGDITEFAKLRVSPSTISLHAILDMFHTFGTWSWCYLKSKVPILLPIKDIWQQTLQHDYLAHRDKGHLEDDATAIPHVCWQSRSWALTARVHRFQSSTSKVCARSQRILLHWSGIGANLHRDDRLHQDATCPICQVPESEHHLLRVCPDPSYRLLLSSATNSASQHIHHHAGPNPFAMFMQLLHAAITDHEHGYLMYFGFITKELANSLPTFNNSDKDVQELRKLVIVYLRLLSEGGLSVIDLARQRRQPQPNIPLFPPIPAAMLHQHPPTAPTADTNTFPTINHPPVRPTRHSKPTTASKSTKPIKSSKQSKKSKADLKKLEKVAQASGQGVAFNRLHYQLHTLSEYFPPVPPTAPLPQHDYATLHPP